MSTLFGKPRDQVVKRPGVFSAAAKKKGMSTAAYTKKVKSDPGASTTLKRRANLAATFASMRAAKSAAK